METMDEVNVAKDRASVMRQIEVTMENEDVAWVIIMSIRVKMRRRNEEDGNK